MRTLNTKFLLLLTLSIAGCAAKYRTVHEKSGADEQASSDQIGDNQPPTIINNNPDDFVITANPLIVLINEEVTFTGDCGDNDERIVTWEFGDNSTEVDGFLVKHSYEYVATYEVLATCLEDGEAPKTETVIITVKAPGIEDDLIDNESDIDNSDGGSSDGDGTDGGSSDGDGTDGGSSDGDGTDGGDGTNGGSSDGDGTDGGSSDGDGIDNDDDPTDGGDGNNPGQNPAQTPWQTPIN